jgi:hypothetical protein
LTPWNKRPTNGNGIAEVEDCCANALPLNGGHDVALYPQSGDVTIQQVVLVNPNQDYVLSVWVSTRRTDAQLIWWNDADKTNRVCALITRDWPDYRPETCTFKTPANATKVRVKLKALYNPQYPNSWVVADGWVLSMTGHFYAQTQKTGNFYGVHAKINAITPSPKMREPIFYYATLNVIDTTTYRGLETGWIIGTNTNCQNWFGYSSSIYGWSNQPVNEAYPQATWYNFWLYWAQDNYWRVEIEDNNGSAVIQPKLLNIPGFNVGNRLRVGGEVFSPHRINDMGINYFEDLMWMDINGYWYPWNGFSQQTTSPYYIVQSPVDPLNSIQVGGNNGLSLAPGSPCP